jgi:hypothetical protein
MDNELLVLENPHAPILTLSPASNLTLYGPDGKEAVVDFGGDSVTYSGDLPVDEAAKIFFEAVFQNFKGS